MRRAAVPVLVLLCTLAGCGSDRTAETLTDVPTITERVTVTAPPVPPPTTPPPATVPATTERSRTATAPASAPPEPTGGIEAAVFRVSKAGYAVTDRATYDDQATLRVLIGTGGGKQQAFFFKGESYLGTDTSEPSRGIAVVTHDDTMVTLRYLFRAGHADVRFALDNGKLVPLDKIPPANARG